MSDVIVSTTESTTNVTTVNDVTTIAITNNVVEVSQATAGLQGPPGANSDPTYVFVTNKTGSTLAKGSIVYVSGANGVHTQVSLALATGDITSARTLGWLSENIANNATGLCMVEGYLDGVNTQGVTEGAQLYLSPTIPGAFTQTKPTAADHLVYVGVCAKASAGNGRVFVKVQNGYELNELHDVKTVNLANNDLLRYSASTALWENVAATAITVGSAITAGTASYATNAGTSVYASTSGTSVYATNAGTAVDLSGSITKSQVSDFTSGTVASASTAQQAGTAVYATTSGSASVSGSAVAYTGSITISQITDLANATVTSASTAQQAGTSVYASTAGTSVYATLAGTATYATTSGTSVSISGSITRSQVSDFASGTVANISGTVTQSQVSGLGTALAAKAGLADNNTFTGLNTFNTFTTFQAGTADAIPVRIFGANGQTADLFSVNDYLTNTQFEILADGRAQSLKGIIATVSGTASIPLVVRGTAGQSANITEWQSNVGGTVAFVDSVGRGVFPTVLAGAFTTAQGAHLALQTTAATNKGIIVRGALGQTANYFEIQDSTAGTVLALNSSNTLLFGTGLQSFLSGNGRILAVASGTAIVPLTVRGAASQSANLLEIQDSSASTVVAVTPTGTLRSAGLITAGSSSDVLGQLSVITTATSRIGAVIRGASGQTANLLELQNSGATAVVRADNSGQVIMNALGVSGSPSGISYAYFTTPSASAKPIVVRGAASQTANLQEWQASDGGTAARVTSSGSLVTTQGFAVLGGASISGSIATLLQTSNAARIPLVVQGAASQTADLQQWQNSSGGTVTRITSSGEIVVPSNAIRGNELFTFNYYGRLQEASSGARLSLTKMTAIAANPGTNLASMYFRDGTDAGTLKLVVRAGTAGAETTILDNIPQ